MQAMNCYQMSQYTPVDVPHPTATSLIERMSPMHLMMLATVKIVRPISKSKNDKFRKQYPDWKYFIGEIRQYVGQDNVYFPFIFSLFIFTPDIQHQIVFEHRPAKH